MTRSKTRLWTLPLTLALASTPALARGEVFVPLDTSVGDIDVATLHSYEADSDHDGLSNGVETLELGTDPLDPDTDGDGWLDGPANLRRSLLLLSIERDTTTSFGCDMEDDFYLVVDGARWPQAESTSGNEAVEGWWDIEPGETVSPWIWLEHRNQPVGGPATMRSEIELWMKGYGGWDTDFVIDLDDLDLLEAEPWTPFDITLCQDFTVTLAVGVLTFADPDPLDAYGDSDQDGLSELDEAWLSREFEGMGDPRAPDVWVEVDHTPEATWDERAFTIATSQFRRHGINLRIDDGRFGGGGLIDQEYGLTEAELDDHYTFDFDAGRKGIFRYAQLVEGLWTGGPGARVEDKLVVDTLLDELDDPTAMAGSFMHELGHALGLVTDRFPSSFIDKVTGSVEILNYQSCMAPYWRTKVADYSAGDQPEQGDLDDWGNLDLGWDLPATVTSLSGWLVL